MYDRIVFGVATLTPTHGLARSADKINTHKETVETEDETMENKIMKNEERIQIDIADVCRAAAPKSEKRDAKWIHTAEVTSPRCRKILQSCAGLGARANDDARTSAIPKTLKEFILIKIKTSSKTPNNDTKEAATKALQKRGMETTFAYYVMANLVRARLSHRCFDHRAPPLPRHFHLICQMTFILANIAAARAPQPPRMPSHAMRRVIHFLSVKIQKMANLIWLRAE